MLFTVWPLVALPRHFTACRITLLGKKKPVLVMGKRNSFCSSVVQRPEDGSYQSRLPPRTRYDPRGWAGRFP